MQTSGIAALTATDRLLLWPATAVSLECFKLTLMAPTRLFFIHLTIIPVLALASAQAAHADEHEGWVYQCLGDEARGTTICTTEIAALHDGRDYLVYFVHAEDGSAPLVIDGGEDAFARTVITVDENDPIETDQCEPGACYFADDAAKTVLQQFRNGGAARVLVVGPDAEIFLDKTITLRGFSKAFSQAGSAQ